MTCYCAHDEVPCKYDLKIETTLWFFFFPLYNPLPFGFKNQASNCGGEKVRNSELGNIEAR